MRLAWNRSSSGATTRTLRGPGRLRRPRVTRTDQRRGTTTMADDSLQGLRAELQRLRDIEEIRQLRARYFLCVDHQEWERWGREVLTEDFHFESDAGVQDG